MFLSAAWSVTASVACELAERERDLAAREAVVEERARIAREMHDVDCPACLDDRRAGRGGAKRARRRGKGRLGDPGRACNGRGSGRSALIEMRRLLGMLREEERIPSRRSPASRTFLRSLRNYRRPGSRSNYQSRGACRAARRDRIVRLPDRAGGAHQRTQARRQRPTTVYILYGTDSIELEIADNGNGECPRRRPAAATASSGCANESRSTAAVSKPAVRPAAASSLKPHFQSNDHRPHRRRPGAGARRPA